MSGIDNYTADGLEGFKLLDKLINSVHASPKRKEHLENLKKASLLTSGCMWLSSKATAPPAVVSLHSAMKKYQTSQKIVGMNTVKPALTVKIYSSVLATFTICGSPVSENEKEEQFYDLQCAVTYILKWMRDILRAAHTRQTKVQAL